MTTPLPDEFYDSMSVIQQGFLNKMREDPEFAESMLRMAMKFAESVGQANEQA